VHRLVGQQQQARGADVAPLGPSASPALAALEPAARSATATPGSRALRVMAPSAAPVLVLSVFVSFAG
jgi:hypothetical protein